MAIIIHDILPMIGELLSVFYSSSKCTWSTIGDLESVTVEGAPVSCQRWRDTASTPRSSGLIEEPRPPLSAAGWYGGQNN